MRVSKNNEYVYNLAWNYRFESENNLNTPKKKVIDAIILFLEKEDKELVEVLKNDFFNTTLEKNWWEDKYSYSTYYRIKNKAVNIFINLHNTYVDKYK